MCRRYGTGQQQAKAEQIEREPRGGLSLVESPIKHFHAQLQNGGQACGQGLLIKDGIIQLCESGGRLVVDWQLCYAEFVMLEA